MKFKESKSIYLQIADRICDEILQGQYMEESVFHRSENTPPQWR